jgi:predicted TPR repeat methyltransferase
LSEFFDKDYYENGICTGKSCYVNYRWMPEITIKLAYNLIKHLNLNEHDTLLDYGCAKGYLVKALRILDVDAFGCDSSEYAISTVDTDVMDFCYNVESKDNVINQNYDWLMTKDVLEHMTEADIDQLLTESSKKVKNMFHVIPLGIKNGKFIIQEYHDDPSHIQIQTEKWWTEKFNNHGWEVVSFSYKVNGIKSNWTEKYDKGNGFFTLKRKK